MSDVARSYPHDRAFLTSPEKYLWVKSAMNGREVESIPFPETTNLANPAFLGLRCASKIRYDLNISSASCKKIAKNDAFKKGGVKFVCE
jgi:hypothetical protein